MPRHAIVTGSAGAIGSALVETFQQAGYVVCGLDRTEPSHVRPDQHITVDLYHLVHDMPTQQAVLRDIGAWLGQHALDVLVNNAAYQYVSHTHPIPVDEWTRSHSVNVLAPYVLTTALANRMTPGVGSVVNIGSAGFDVGYKAAQGMPRSSHLVNPLEILYTPTTSVIL